MNFEERRRLFESHFTDLEDDICDYISANKTQIQDVKIIELARQFYTVPNTITRLCHKLQYTGFLELKKSLCQESSDSQAGQETTYLDFVHKNVDLIKQIEHKKVIELFRKSKQVIIFAVGSTAFVAKIFVDTLNAVENKFYFIEYEHELRKQVNQKEKKTILFISLTGETEPGLQLAKDAKSLGHQVISLTHFADNSLSKVADLELYCISPKRTYDGSNVTDKLPLLIVLERLFTSYSER